MDRAREATLVRRALDGDVRAFEELVEVYQRVLFNVAMRMVNDREDARDLTQTAFLQAWRGLGTYDPTHRFFSWIYRILVNGTLNHLARQRPREEIGEDIPSDDMPSDEQAGRNRTSEVIQESLLELSTDHREVVVLRHLLDQSYREIADLLGIPEKTVKSRLYTARQQLAGVLTRRGVTTT